MNIAWEDWRVFLAVAEGRSMSAAALSLGVGQPTVSRRLKALEGELGYPLFRRSVSGVALTSAAERLLEPARRMAEWAGEVGRAASSADTRPAGVVRITAPPGVAYDFVVPFARALHAKHPELKLEVLSSITYLDLGRGEADLALRNRPAAPDQHTVTSITTDLDVFAAPAYGRLPRPLSLAALRWVAWSPPHEEVPPNPQLRAMIPGFSPVFTADSFILLRQAVEAGVGVMPLGRLRSRHALPTAIRPLGLDLGPYRSVSHHLVCAKSALDVPRVRAVAEALAEELQHVRRL